MKSIKYLFVIVLVCITMISSSWKSTGKENTIVLQAAESNASSELLKKSADIISKRITDYGLDSFCIIINEEKRQIEITLPVSADVNELETLLSAKGVLAFYETYNTEELTALLKDKKLIDMLTFSPYGRGCISAGKVNSVNECIGSYGKIDRCILCWGKSDDNSQACLYALKPDNNGFPLIVRSDIKSVSSSRENFIEAEFTPEAAVKFAESTSKNLNKSIAIVIDDKVISAPVVKGAIMGGKCEISGKFTRNGTGFLLAILNSEPLPLSFDLIK
jgi:preprotein translocase subunit SecD